MEAQSHEEGKDSFVCGKDSIDTLLQFWMFLALSSDLEQENKSVSDEVTEKFSLSF